MTAVRPLVAGNWKMNGLRASLAEAETVKRRLASAGRPRADAMICPPATLLPVMTAADPDAVLLYGGQDCHSAPSGAHTGDLAAEMLADAGASAVIVGHSERRTDHGETDALVRAKAQAAHRAGLTAIVCLGETRAEREAGRTLDRVASQIAGSLPETARPDTTVIAYEPVWAIGTGLTPTPGDIADVHGFIRARLAERLGDAAARAVRILYGGSVKPDNAAELMAVDNVDGALVGGASLKAVDFLAILSAYAR